MVVFKRRPVIIPSARAQISFLHVICDFLKKNSKTKIAGRLSVLSHLRAQISFTRYFAIFFCSLLWCYIVYHYPISVPRNGLHVLIFFPFTIMVSLCIIIPFVWDNTHVVSLVIY